MQHYSVVLSGFKRGEEFFRGRMMKQGMKVAAIERVIQSCPCILKHGLSLDEARRFEALFREAGALVEVRKDGEALEPAAGAGPLEGTGERKLLSQPRLTPLVQPLPAPPEEPAPAAPAAPMEMLDLLDGPPPAGATPAAPAPDPADATPPPALTTGVVAGERVPVAARPPAVFVHHNPWIFRGLTGGFAFVLALIAVSCVSKYKVADRIHDFSATVDDDLANDLVGVARAHGGVVGEAELMELVGGYARHAHVKVAISNLHAGLAAIQQAPDGSCAGLLPVMAAEMPPQKRMAWMLRMRHCAPEPWVIAFDVSISARYGLSRDTVATQQWVFAGEWSDGER